MSLRSHALSAEPLLLASKTGASLLERIQHWAMLSTLQYAVFSTVLSTPELPTEIGTNSFQGHLAYLRLTYELLAANAEEEGVAALRALGEDFASALGLLLESTYDLAALYERQASVGSSDRAPRAEKDWGKGSPRHKLVSLLFGPSEGLRHVSASMSDSRLQSLLELARSADALYLRLRDQGLAGFPGTEFLVPDVQGSAREIFRRVEQHLVQRECERQCDSAACERECSFAVESTLLALPEAEETLLFQRYSVGLSVAERLTEALFEALDMPSSLFDPALMRGRIPATTLHVLGRHTRDGEWLRVARGFKVASPTGAELQHHARGWRGYASLPLEVNWAAGPFANGALLSVDESGQFAADFGEPFAALGTVPALVYVRHVLARSSESPQFAGFFAPAVRTLPEIERAIGERTTIIGGSRFQRSEEFHLSDYEVEHIAPATGEFRTLVVRAPSPQSQSVARDPGTTSLFDKLHYQGLRDHWRIADASPPEPLGGAYAPYHRLRWHLAAPSRRNFVTESIRQLFLTDGSAGSGKAEAFVGVVHPGAVRPGAVLPNPSAATTDDYVASGGALHAMAERAMEVNPLDWSRPANDAFGPRRHFLSPVVAQFISNSSAGRGYVGLLDNARRDAERAVAIATSAIEQANLEMTDALRLGNAERTAARNQTQEQEALCGRRARCEVPLAAYVPAVPACPAPRCDGATCDESTLRTSSQCDDYRSLLGEALPELELASVVVQADPFFGPDLSDFAGSEMARLLSNQYQSMEELEAELGGFVDVAQAVAAQQSAAEVRRSRAQHQRELAASRRFAQESTLAAEDAKVEATLADERFGELAELEEGLTAARERVERECSDEAFTAAQREAVGLGKADIHPRSVAAVQNSGVGVGAQQADCDAATQHLEDLEGTEDLQVVRAATLSLVANEAWREVYLQERDAELAYAEAAAAAAAVNASGAVRVSDALFRVQRALGALRATRLEQSRLATRYAAARARHDLNLNIASREIALRQGVRRRFRSNLWLQAEQALDNARRSALLARRAVESRFVVDLSDAEDPIVARFGSDNWADQIYDLNFSHPDADKPFSVDSLVGDVYVAGIRDYVEDLEQFVGFYISGSGLLSEDSQVEHLVLEGPGAIDPLHGGLSRRVQQWTFFCGRAEGWIPHPGLGERPLSTEIETACQGGERPTHARVEFTLNPYGRLNAALEDKDVGDTRYNHRWGALAVRLTSNEGGIKDCARPGAALACREEEFVRFRIVHRGPIWAVDHSQNQVPFSIAPLVSNGEQALSAYSDAMDFSVGQVNKVAVLSLVERPMNGRYEFELELTPEVDISKIEKVELLVERHFWRASN